MGPDRAGAQAQPLGLAAPGRRTPEPPVKAPPAQGTRHGRQGAVKERYGDPMKVILNIIWLVLCGIWMSLAYVVAGLVCFLLFFLIITIPFGIAAFRIANYVLWPFGRTIEARRDAGVGSLIGNIIWIIFAGWWLAIGHLVTGVALCLTIIGIPLGIACFKIIPISLLPLGVQIVPTASVAAGRV